MLGRIITIAAGFGLALAAPAAAQAPTAVHAGVTIDAHAAGTRIPPEIYGQFAEQLGYGINGGIWVGEESAIPNIRGYRRDVVEALRRLKVPVVRWPGGCYGDIYHWRNGIGPRDRRPVTLNKWWGNVEERNQFGTHEFFDFAELIGAKTYLSLNVGSGTPQESMEWIEYITSPGHSTLAELRRANGRDEPWKIDYLGIGNETWGCGGNMTAEEYAALMKRWSTFVHQDNGPQIVASGAHDTDYHWTEALTERARDQFDQTSLHYYTLPTGKWDHKGAALGFDEAAWADTFQRTRAIEGMIVEHEARMSKFDPEKKKGLAVDEWGTWYDPTSGTNGAFLIQENSLRDALVAATNFHIFQRHLDRVRMANIAQMVNVLQAMIETDGPRMVLTPTYYAFLLYQPFQGAVALPVTVQSPDYVVGSDRMPAVDVAAARDSAGVVHVALVNVDPRHGAAVDLALDGVSAGAVTGQILTAPAMDSHNSFDHPNVVVPAGFSGARWRGAALHAELPAKSVVVLAIGAARQR